MALINDPRKLFAYKLGTVLSGEKKILTMLKKQEKRAQREELKRQFRHHREETEGQIRNIEQAFDVLGETEHVEIALYEDLITQARGLGEQQVVSLLQQNLEQEQHTLEEVKRASEQLAQRSGRQMSAVGSGTQPSGIGDTGRD